MGSHFIISSKKSVLSLAANIFANRSSLILYELLLRKERGFSIQSLAAEAGVSIGLAHKVVVELVHEGLVSSTGVRTAKKYELAKPSVLLQRWIAAYNITKKCRFRNYSSPYSREELKKKLKALNPTTSVVLALHSAAREIGAKFTNLETVEMYLSNPVERLKVEKLLRLEPQERGYQVLLIDPYYSSLLTQRTITKKGFKISPTLLTFLDLYHFPLRGQEQAEALARHDPTLNAIFRIN